MFSSVFKNFLFPSLTVCLYSSLAKSNFCISIMCEDGSLDPERVKGRILVCLTGEEYGVEQSGVALRAGAVGLILANNKKTGDKIIAKPHLLPASNLNFADGEHVFTYINSTR